jgi:UDP-N-acetylmuramyl pentapeptide phosphotransferase/UDP-N-acetylglucosamine-1-phosphate transferase
MKAFTLAGILLLLVAFAAFTYQGFYYTTSEEVVDVGLLQVSKETDHSVPLTPLVGGIALVGGFLLLVLGYRQTT